VRDPKVLLPLLIIVNACIWGFTILMVAHTLRGTGAYQEIQHILGAAAAMSIVIVGGGMAGLVKSLRTAQSEPDSR
jgi:hypothetical protein